MSTAALHDDAPVDPDDELLVAYLDGELDREQRTSVENRLVEEIPLRTRLQQLQTGWDLLSELPDPAPSQKLVESTLELAVTDVLQDNPNANSFWRRFRIPLSALALSLLGVMGVLGITAAGRNREYRRQLQDLAIAEHFDAYNQGGDIALMRQLASETSWAKMVEASREVGELNLDSIAEVSAMPLDERSERVTHLSLEKRAQLYSRWERFLRLDETNRDRLRATADAVARQPDAELLLQTMQTYAVWREKLSTDLRDQITSSDNRLRREAIRSAIAQTQRSNSRQSSAILDDETTDVIYLALRQTARQRLSDRDPPTVRLRELLKSRRSSDPDLGVIWGIVRASELGRWSTQRRQGFRSPPRDSERPSPLGREELELIRFVLPDQAIDILSLVSGDQPDREAEALQAWAVEALRRHSPGREADETSLLDRYGELSATQREVIDLLPPSEILQRLEQPDRPRRLGPP